jgi:hypothetical protein
MHEVLKCNRKHKEKHRDDMIIIKLFLVQYDVKSKLVQDRIKVCGVINMVMNPRFL